MANFTPQWDINTNKPIIIEGEDSLNTVTISKYDKNDMANFTYELGSNFELVMTYTINIKAVLSTMMMSPSPLALTQII